MLQSIFVRGTWIALALVLAACGQGDLTREIAKEKLQETFPKGEIPVYRDVFRNRGAAMNFARGSNGYLEGEDLLAVVKPEVKDLDEKLFFLSLRKPAITSVEVTGITAPNAESNERIVEYKITFRDIPAVVKLFAGTHIRCRTTFTQFDDGWRAGAPHIVDVGPITPQSAFTEAENAIVQSIVARVQLERQAEKQRLQQIRDLYVRAVTGQVTKVYATHQIPRTREQLGGVSEIRVTNRGIDILTLDTKGNVQSAGRYSHLFGIMRRGEHGATCGTDGWVRVSNFGSAREGLAWSRQGCNVEPFASLVREINEGLDRWKIEYRELIESCPQNSVWLCRP
ncbi:MAG: hypothetical protein IPK54_14140 [Dokdonella sp.]|uniref:hypothetical protein n=1 Tax=Dokdonella sp. TaxID=2291710 RepID=UPI0025C19269|nr:hypothetical protein [Dokdonella sp.]MBK8124675.1 hypothetical protein [Dokdonella sp.]